MDVGNPTRFWTEDELDNALEPADKMRYLSVDLTDIKMPQYNKKVDWWHFVNLIRFKGFRINMEHMNGSLIVDRPEMEAAFWRAVRYRASMLDSMALGGKVKYEGIWAQVLKVMATFSEEDAELYWIGHGFKIPGLNITQHVFWADGVEGEDEVMVDGDMILTPVIRKEVQHPKYEESGPSFKETFDAWIEEIQEDRDKMAGDTKAPAQHQDFVLRQRVPQPASATSKIQIDDVDRVALGEDKTDMVEDGFGFGDRGIGIRIREKMDLDE